MIWAILGAVIFIGCMGLLIYPSIKVFFTPNKRNSTVFNSKLRIEEIRRQNEAMRKRGPTYVEQQEKLQAIRRSTPVDDQPSDS